VYIGASLGTGIVRIRLDMCGASGVDFQYLDSIPRLLEISIARQADLFLL
jgi:hypothetical protein